MAERTPLFQSNLVAVHRFAHADGCDTPEPVSEEADNFVVSFVERGHFGIETRKNAWHLETGDILLLHPGLKYRVRHDDGDLSDTCFSVTYRGAPDTQRALWHSWTRVFSPVLGARNRLLYLNWGLSQAATTRNTLALESLAGELLMALPERPATHERRATPRQFDEYAQRVTATKERLDRSYADEHSLSGLARSVTMSPFHFLRVFRSLTGVSPHQYLVTARLRAAKVMLQDGASVTEACFASGFSNLSHFSRTFKKRFGYNANTLVRN